MSELTPPMRVTLRLESLLVLLVSVALYQHREYSWWLFPDTGHFVPGLCVWQKGEGDRL